MMTANSADSLSTSSTESTSQCSYLPPELLHLVFQHLRPPDFDAARHVSRQWYGVSTSRLLLRQQLRVLSPHLGSDRLNSYSNNNSDSQPPQSPPDDLDPDDISLRRAFEVEVDRWPGSRHRVACNRLNLSTRALQGAPDGGEVEHVAFSRGGGTFVGIVTKGKDGKRKLWINRLFSFRHSTYGFRPRGPFGELCVKDLETAPCMPGMLYLTLELTQRAAVMSVDIIEHPVFSAVREILVRFIDGTIQSTKFTEYQPVRQGIEDFLGAPGTRYVDIGDTTWQTCECTAKTLPASAPSEKRIQTSRFRPFSLPIPISIPIPFPRRRRKVVEDIRDLKPLKHVEHTPSPPPPSNPQLLVKLSNGPFDANSPRQFCHTLLIPYSDGKRHYRVIITPSHELIITNLLPTTAFTPGVPLDTATAAYILRPGKRLHDSPSQIRHLTVAPRFFFDFCSGIWWACVVAAYENGELWLWRINTQTLETSSSSASNPSTVTLVGGEPKSTESAPVSTPTPISDPEKATHPSTEIIPDTLSSPNPPTSISSKTTTTITPPLPSSPPNSGTLTLPPTALNPFRPPPISKSHLLPINQPTHLPSPTGSTTSLSSPIPFEQVPLELIQPQSLSPSALSISSFSLVSIKKLTVDMTTISESAAVRPQAWRLGWEAGNVLRCEFVGKGQTLLVGTEERIVVVEFRCRDGRGENGELRARFG